jgi:hypothetical protein
MAIISEQYKKEALLTNILYSVRPDFLDIGS